MEIQTEAPLASVAEETEEAEERVIDDRFGTVGILFGVMTLCMILMGVLIPVLPWVLSGLLGMITIVLGLLARTRRMFWTCIGIGLIGLFPLTIFILVQALPGFQSR